MTADNNLETVIMKVTVKLAQTFPHVHQASRAFELLTAHAELTRGELHQTHKTLSDVYSQMRGGLARQNLHLAISILSEYLDQ